MLRVYAHRYVLGSVTALAGTGAVLTWTARAAAVTTLTVNLGASIGPAMHVASGSLYGVTETLPADVDKFIAPLHPRMFTNPAANVQQPVGDAIVVAGRVASTGATVTIRLADWLKGFYTFTSMSDWLDKVAQTVARRKSANLTNVYGYEIWNEPGGTWAASNPISFNEFWRQTFARLRELDPGIKIIGPSLSYYNQSSISSFLSFCKTNGCVPDIMSWHELSGGNVSSNIENYRALEKQLGISPLPISINEYSGNGRIDVEGQPGASAPLIAKFERARVDSACISYWDVSHPGRLGSLMATNTQPNGGWWFYKWYGEMTGNMVTTVPPEPSNATALDGFASLDDDTPRASILLGGTNDGTIRVVVNGFRAAPAMGARVRAVVERTPFANRTTVVTQTTTLSSSELDVANDQVSLMITGANASDGYRVTLQPVGGGGLPGSGGASAGGAGGRNSAGGAASAGSSSQGGTSGANTSGGRAGASGSESNGGRQSSGGQGGRGDMNAGGAISALGGFSNSGGGGGNLTQGGGAALGGSSAEGGTPPRGGTDARGGATASAGATASNPGGGSEPGGCSCRVPRRASPSSTPREAIALAVALLLVRFRRRPHRPRNQARA